MITLLMAMSTVIRHRILLGGIFILVTTNTVFEHPIALVVRLNIYVYSLVNATV
jgi:hypothetical protein